jgi:hypothetical protein
MEVYSRCQLLVHMATALERQYERDVWCRSRNMLLTAQQSLVMSIEEDLPLGCPYPVNPVNPKNNENEEVLRVHRTWVFILESCAGCNHHSRHIQTIPRKLTSQAL